MPSFKRLYVALLLLVSSSVARAEPAPGFAVERFYASAPGAGWLVMDALDMRGGLGGATAFTLGYADNPLRVTDGVRHLAVVSQQAFADFGLAVTYSRWRFYLDVDVPVATTGNSGTVGDYSFVGPAVNPGGNPDTVTDPRLGADVRIFGGPADRFRLGASAQLFVPNGHRNDYDTDGTFRGMLRVLFAGDVGRFTYAGHVGVHIRPLDDSTAPGSPRGSELLFGVAAGAKLPIGRAAHWVAVVGPEIYGATAFRSFLTTNGTDLEGLVSARFEGGRDERLQTRVKLGVGAGINQHFGAPEWRMVLSVELFSHHFATDLR